MLDQLWNYVALAGLLVALVVVWAISVRAVFADTRRRQLSTANTIYWLALAIALPMVGGLVYLAVRLADMLLPARADEPVWDAEPMLTGTGGPLVQPAPYIAPPPAPLLDPPAPPTGQTRQPPARKNGNGHHLGNGSASGSRQEEGETRPVGVGQSPPLVRVYIVEGPEAGRSVLITRLPALIGRSAQAQVRIEIDPALSRQHAELYWGAGGLRIRDLSSLHGTLVNGVRQEDQPVQPGDRIEVGYSILVVELPKGDQV